MQAPRLSAIVAVSANKVIGVDNKMPWHLPADLAYFKKITSGHAVLMGRKCFESIGRKLPNRLNIVVTRNENWQKDAEEKGIAVFENLGEAIKFGQNESPDNHLFIIGGGEIYEQTKDKWTHLYLTEVEINLEGDVFFPSINQGEWQLISQEKHLANEKNAHNYTFKVYEKI